MLARNFLARCALVSLCPVHCQATPLARKERSCLCASRIEQLFVIIIFVTVLRSVLTFRFLSHGKRNLEAPNGKGNGDMILPSGRAGSEEGHYWS